MQIIPVINCENFECVKEKLKKAEKFFDGLLAESAKSAEKKGWVQIDIADGEFTRAPEPPTGGSVRGFAPHKTWNNPDDLLDVKGQLSDVNIEIHLMVENPLEVIDVWIKAGVKRIIVHYEAIYKEAARSENNDETDVINFLLEKCVEKGVELGLAINPDTPIESIIRHLDRVRFIQLLAVNPGLAGQQFQATTLQKIKFLRELNDNYSNVIIEVDGGINLEIAKMCKEAGADILASASYIWNSNNPEIALKELQNL